MIKFPTFLWVEKTAMESKIDSNNVWIHSSEVIHLKNIPLDTDKKKKVLENKQNFREKIFPSSHVEIIHAEICNSLAWKV